MKILFYTKADNDFRRPDNVIGDDGEKKDVEL